ncbi:YncE family protein [Fodinibius saliphilus]|uniref:YncE family protein n=1 Tax=Fodinibius saliphilus TaxID=1920650 RepID=UPI001109EAD3|nr:ATP-binding protein [Fodinibius saliphilus]
MKVFSIFLIGLFISINLQAQSLTKTINGFSHPESIVVQNGYLYISNIGQKLQPTAKDEDGFISKVDLSSFSIEQLHYLPQLHAPKGLAIVQNTLYVADIDRLLGFDLTNRKQVFELSLEDAKYLNDIVVKNKQTLFVSATKTGKIARVDLRENSYQYLNIPKIKGANGLALSDDKAKLFCVGFGQNNKPNGSIVKIDLSQLEMEKVSSYQGYLDGIQYQNNELFFSDWKDFKKKGVLNKLDLNSEKVTLLSLEELMAGPADFSIYNRGNQFIVPALLENKVYIIEQ